MSSLIFTESFIEDMLNMTQMGNDTFTLVSQKFEVQKVFDFVMNIFEPLCSAKNIGLELEITKNLNESSSGTLIYDDEIDNSQGLLIIP